MGSRLEYLIWPICFVLVVATLDIYIMKFLRSGIRKQYEELREESELGEDHLAEYLKRTIRKDQVLDDDLDNKEIIAMAAFRYGQIGRMGEPENEEGRKIRYEGMIILAWIGIAFAGINIIIGLCLWNEIFMFPGLVIAALMFVAGMNYGILLDIKDLNRKQLDVIRDAL
jgi:hypothetical protein